MIQPKITCDLDAKELVNMLCQLFLGVNLKRKYEITMVSANSKEEPLKVCEPKAQLDL